MYQRAGRARGYRIDLENTHRLMEVLEHPERKFRCIHVAGTNGKGSVSHMLASVLQEAGFKTGLYTSPHLIDFRERVRINGQLIPEQAAMDFVATNREVFDTIGLSFFEYTVGLAFDYFARQQVDIAIIETGLGGRLDSTNVVSPLLCGITNIGLDHQDTLGETLEAIAGEKAGIIKPGIPVVIGRRQAETKAVFEQMATRQNAPLHYAESMELPELSVTLEGSYQQENARTAVALLSLLPAEFSVPTNTMEKGVQNVYRNTGLLGRWQTLATKPLVICDNGHNTEGITTVLENIAATPHNKLHIVFGAVAEKELNAIFTMLPANASYYYCRPDIPRGLAVQTLVEQAELAGRAGRSFLSVGEAVKAARVQANDDDLIFIGGSTFVVAEALPLFPAE